MSTTVTIGSGSTRVSVGGPAKRVTLNRSTIAQIRDHRPRTAVVSNGTSVAIDSGVTTVRTGGGMGVQGPQGEPGFSGAGVIEPITWHWGDAPSAVYVPAEAGTLVLARLKVDTPFNGVGASIRVGTLAAPESVLPAEWIDPYSELEFENTPDIALAAGEAVRIEITPGTASQGAGRLFLQFLPNP